MPEPPAYPSATGPHGSLSGCSSEAAHPPGLHGTGPWHPPLGTRPSATGCAPRRAAPAPRLRAGPGLYHPAKGPFCGKLRQSSPPPAGQKYHRLKRRVAARGPELAGLCPPTYRNPCPAGHPVAAGYVLAHPARPHRGRRIPLTGSWTVNKLRRFEGYSHARPVQPHRAARPCAQHRAAQTHSKAASTDQPFQHWATTVQDLPARR